MPSYTLHYFDQRGRAEICRLLFAAAGVPYTDRRIDFSEWNGFRSKMPGSMLPVLEIDGRTQMPQSMAIARYLAREFGFHGRNNFDMARIDYICDCFYDIVDDYLRMYHDRDGRVALDRMSDMRQRYYDIDGRMAHVRSDLYREQPGLGSDLGCGTGLGTYSGTQSGTYSGTQSGTYSGTQSEFFNEDRMFERRRRYIETCRRVLPFLERTLEVHHNGNQYFMGDQLTLCDLMCYAALESPLYENPSLLSNYPKLRVLRERVASHSKISSYFKRRGFSDF